MLTLAALGVMLGLWYRASAITLALAFSYVEFLDKTTYLNHYYLASLLALLLALLPAGRAFSLVTSYGRDVPAAGYWAPAPESLYPTTVRDVQDITWSN